MTIDPKAEAAPTGGPGAGNGSGGGGGGRIGGGYGSTEKTGDRVRLVHQLDPEGTKGRRTRKADWEKRYGWCRYVPTT